MGRLSCGQTIPIVWIRHGCVGDPGSVGCTVGDPSGDVRAVRNLMRKIAAGLHGAVGHSLGW